MCVCAPTSFLPNNWLLHITFACIQVFFVDTRNLLENTLSSPLWTELACANFVCRGFFVVTAFIVISNTTPGVGTTARYLKPFQSWCVSSPVYQLGRRVVVMRTRAVALRGNTLMAVGAHRRPWQGGRLLMAETKTAAPQPPP